MIIRLEDECPAELCVTYPLLFTFELPWDPISFIILLNQTFVTIVFTKHAQVVPSWLPPNGLSQLRNSISTSIEPLHERDRLKWN